MVFLENKITVKVHDYQDLWRIHGSKVFDLLRSQENGEVKPGEKITFIRIGKEVRIISKEVIDKLEKEASKKGKICLICQTENVWHPEAEICAGCRDARKLRDGRL